MGSLSVQLGRLGCLRIEGLLGAVKIKRWWGSEIESMGGIKHSITSHTSRTSQHLHNSYPIRKNWVVLY